MDKDDLMDFADNPKFIPGIYNYCDRWCERCSFTSRCLNYDLGNKKFDDPEIKDIKNKLFWEKISEQLKATMDLIEDEAEELGIDLNDPENDTGEDGFKFRHKEIERYEIVNSAKKYIGLADKWFESSEKELAEKRELLNLEENLKVDASNSLDRALKITDASDVIRWYQIQISVKLERAIFSRLNEIDEFDDEFQKDSDGSAKVALIGIDRSIAAWGRLYNHFDETEDEILSILLHLTNLRDNVESEFPQARSFVRIGFDEY